MVLNTASMNQTSEISSVKTAARNKDSQTMTQWPHMELRQPTGKRHVHKPKPGDTRMNHQGHENEKPGRNKTEFQLVKVYLNSSGTTDIIRRHPFSAHSKETRIKLVI